MYKSESMKDYLMLTKPGIIFGNAITATAGYFLALQGPFNLGLFLATLCGLSLVIASACVYNNYIDRDMDQKMARTRNRALAKGVISVQAALRFGLLLGSCGIVLLAFCTTTMAALLAASGFFVYVVIYSLSKYRTALATLIGSIAGAIPPVVGYTAVSGELTLASLILFAIVVFWQMPHFYAIAMYRLPDYVQASIPVLPVIKGNFSAKVRMTGYVVLFSIASILLFTCGFKGYTYLAMSILLSLSWLGLALQGFSKSTNDVTWARKMFLMSLFIISALSLAIIL
jgi:protoheme IX farnesyltransferase